MREVHPISGLPKIWFYKCTDEGIWYCEDVTVRPTACKKNPAHTITRAEEQAPISYGQTGTRPNVVKWFQFVDTTARGFITAEEL